MQSEALDRWPLISVITVNLNGRAHLEALLDSLATQQYPAERIEVIVVDNGSTDDSISFLTSVHPRVKILANQRNEGFARPNNQAAAIARGQYLALVNNDMKLDPHWLGHLVDFIEAGPADVACVGSRILNWDGSAVDFINGEMAFNGMGFQPGYGALVASPEASCYPDELLFACGGALLIKKDVFLEVGGFDEDYFAYYEDVDLGWRLWVQGHRVRFCPEAVVHHRHNGTSSRFEAHKKVVLMERNAMFSVLKNYDDETLRTVWPAALLLTFKRIGVRSGIERESFRFGPRPPVPPSPSVAPESTLRKLLRSLYRLGLAGTFKKAIVILAEKVLVKWASRSFEGEVAIPVTKEAYASVVGMEDVLDFLPRMLAKRREIQARRRRSDAEVFRRFGSPLQAAEIRKGYPDAHWLIVKELGLDALFADEVSGAEGPRPQEEPGSATHAARIKG